jgi:hypothetical protein
MATFAFGPAAHAAQPARSSIVAIGRSVGGWAIEPWPERGRAMASADPGKQSSTSLAYSRAAGRRRTVKPRPDVVGDCRGDARWIT